MKTIRFTIALVALVISHRAFSDGIRVTAAMQSNFNIALRWNANTGRVYRVQFKTNLADVWRDVPGEATKPCPLDTYATRILLTSTAPQRFLRIADVGATTSVPLGFQGTNGEWLLFHHFSMGVTNTQPTTNIIFVTRGGFALQGYQGVWDVIDGPALGVPLRTEQNIIFNELMNDERVAFVYPGRTDSTFQSRLFYDDIILLKLNSPFSDIGIVLADYHLALVSYLSSADLYVTRVTSKADDPFTVVAALNSDPRIEFAEVNVRFEPRSPCSLPP